MLYEEGLPYLWGLWHLTAFILKPPFNLWKIMYCQRFCLLLLIILISSKTSLRGFLRFNSDTPAASWEVANALSPDDVEHQDIQLWGSGVQLLSHHQREAYYTIFYWEDEQQWVCVCVCGHSCFVVSSSLRPHGLQPARLLCPQDYPWWEYWSGLPFLTPGDLPNPGIKPASLAFPALADGSFTTSATWEARTKR